MQAIKLQYIKDEKGETQGVFLSEAEFEYWTRSKATCEKPSSTTIPSS